MQADFKNAERSGGTYRIVNTVNGKVYYGSAKQLKKRFGDHERSLLQGKHANAHLQRAFDTHGSAAFLFEVLTTYGAESDRLEAEQALLDTHHDGGAVCYNIEKRARACGPKDPERTSSRKSAAKAGSSNPMFGKTVSEETRCKMRASHLGQNTWSRGRHHTAEARAKISAANAGRPLSEEHKAKIRAANTGKSMPEATRRKLREANRGRVPPNKGGKMPDHVRAAASATMFTRATTYGMRNPRAKVYEDIRLVSPAGVVHTRIECLSAFCRDHDLWPSGLCNVLRGKLRQTEGWHLETQQGVTL